MLSHNRYKPLEIRESDIVVRRKLSFNGRELSDVVSASTHFPKRNTKEKVISIKQRLNNKII